MYLIDKFIKEINSYQGKLSESISILFDSLKSNYDIFLQEEKKFKSSYKELSSIYIEEEKDKMHIRFCFCEDKNYFHYYYNLNFNISYVTTTNCEWSFVKKAQPIIDNNSVLIYDLFLKAEKLYHIYTQLSDEFHTFVKEQAAIKRPPIMNFLKKHSLNELQLKELAPLHKKNDSLKILSFYLKNNMICADFVYLNKYNQYDFNKSKCYFQITRKYVPELNSYENIYDSILKLIVLFPNTDILKGDYYVNIEITSERIKLTNTIENF